jgi:cell wall-associated NlpC family hydrolase
MDHKSIIKSILAVNTLSFFAVISFSCASSSRSAKSSPDNARPSVSNSRELNTQTIPEDKLRRIVASYLGVRYKTGGMDRRGFDCSGFVVVVFRELCRAKLPRSTKDLKRLGREVPRKDARPGDLVFVKGGVFNSINHVGIYLGNGTFVHASSSKGVRYDRLDDEYYTNHFGMIRRVVP